MVTEKSLLKVSSFFVAVFFATSLLIFSFVQLFREKDVTTYISILTTIVSLFLPSPLQMFNNLETVFTNGNEPRPQAPQDPEHTG